MSAEQPGGLGRELKDAFLEGLLEIALGIVGLVLFVVVPGWLGYLVGGGLGMVVGAGIGALALGAVVVVLRVLGIALLAGLLRRSWRR